MDTDDADDLARTPAISVCVPSYNNSTTLARCLRSILERGTPGRRGVGTTAGVGPARR